MSYNAPPIDIVIAWVDGNDPKLKNKRMQYLDNQQPSDAVSTTRFASDNEVYYNIASILKYVPFCRYIYIVADDQRPEYIDEFAQQNICDPDKIKVVDHKTIFVGYEQHLPTFNTRSIETMLWNIPNLSDYFIYMNDDFFFNSPARVADVLDGNSIVTYGHWSSSIGLKIKLFYRQWLKTYFNKPIQPKHMIAQMLGADRLGFKQFFEIHHYPHIVDRNILQQYLMGDTELLERQIRYKFRSVEQLNPISLMNHLKIKQDEAILKPDLPIAYLKNESSLSSFFDALDNSEIKYGCIQSLDQLPESAAKQVALALNSKFAGFLPKSVVDLTEV